MQYQIRYVVQESEDGVLWHDVCDCASEEEAEEEMIVKQQEELERRAKESGQATTMTEYQLTLCLRAGCLTAEERDRVVAYIEKIGGKIKEEENAGIKTLCYSVEGEARAEFRYFTIDLPKNMERTLEHWFAVEHNVLRYLIIQVDPKRKRKEI